MTGNEITRVLATGASGRFIKGPTSDADLYRAILDDFGIEVL